jgi:hypothetical protein
MAVVTNGRELRWTGAIHPDERAVASLSEEFGVHQRTKQRIANVALEAPQALCLCRCQSKSRHFHELALNPLKHIIDAPIVQEQAAVITRKLLIS